MYKKPVVLLNDDLAEGVFAASGSSYLDPECYTVTHKNHQVPEAGRGDYRFQVDAVHKAADNHHSTEQILTIFFNQPNIQYVSSNGTLISCNDSSVVIKYNYHNNGTDNIGLGDIVVTADPGVAIIDMTLSCNHACGQHTW